MEGVKVIYDEHQRVVNLHSFNLDTTSSFRLDELTKVAAKIFDAPIALISLVDETKQFFKSRFGLEICETNREISFCSHAIAKNNDSPLIIRDTKKMFYFPAILWCLVPPTFAAILAVH